MPIAHSTDLYYCPFYLNNDRLGDRRTVQKYLWKIQCKPSPPMKNISCYIIILLCAVNMPSHILCFAYLLAVATSLRQIMVLRFSAIFSCGLKCDYGASFHLQEGSFSMFNDWIYTSYCCTLHYPILFLECHLLWVEAFWIQTGAPHSCRADSSNSVDIVCKEVFPSKGWPFFTLSLGLCSLSAY